MKKAPIPLPDEFMQTAETLTRALPYMRQFAGKTIVIKYGGHAMGDDTLSQHFARDIVLLKQVGLHPVVVHGGGPQIGKMLERLKIHSEFVDGLRITDRETVEVVEMVLSGSINKSIVSAINTVGGQAIGLSGKDGNLIRARKITRTKRDPDSNIERVLDLGFVGEPVQINPEVLKPFLISDELIPVIAPIGIGESGETYNINADTAAGAIAAALGAHKLHLLTDVPGVLDKQEQLIRTMSTREARQLITDGTIGGGMIPKLETCIHALEQGVGAAHILDGRLPHALLVELFTVHGAGTMVTI